MSRIVVIDASPLIGLAMVDGLKWLPDIFGTVFLPETFETLHASDFRISAAVINQVLVSVNE